jgi:4-hydroxy-tetrahydrodipicolinate synthase
MSASRPSFRGCYTAIVTPFSPDGTSIDVARLERNVRDQAEGGVTGIVPCGTTGESPTLTEPEHVKVVETAVRVGKPLGLQVVAGAGSNSTAHAVHLQKLAKQLGADAGLQVTPYYNKPSQEGIYQHFKAISEAVDLPLVLYNVPGRTVADMLPETTLRLAELPGIVGIKEATGNIERACQLIKHRPEGFAIYSGDDGTAVALMLLGGDGNVSVTANIAPRLMHALCKAAIAGDVATARELHLRLLPLHKQLFCEPSPAPAKWALAQLGRCAPHVRLPIVPLTAAGQAAVGQALREAGVHAV